MFYLTVNEYIGFHKYIHRVMPHDILKPISEEELKIRVEDFINAFISLNKKNQASLEDLKVSYHTVDLMLYRILKGSNGIVDSTRLLDIIQTLLINFMLENDITDGRIKSISEPDKRFICFLGILLAKYTQGLNGPKKEEWINRIINTVISKRFYT